MIKPGYLKNFGLTTIILMGLWILIGYISAKYLTRTNTIDFADITELNHEKVKAITLKTNDSIIISAWLVGKNPDKAVILLSGIKGNRLSQIKRAIFFLKNDFTVLLPDLRGTGKSGGDLITFGWQEKRDLITCINYLKQRNIQKISVVGHSLGAATIVYSSIDYKDFDFIILESCYNNIEDAFKNRIKKFHLPFFVYKPVEFFTAQIIDEKLEKLSPENLVENIHCPVLILAGDMENQIFIDETRTIYNNCETSKKRLHIFHEGKHEDFYSRFPKEYETEVIKFLNELVYIDE